MERQSSFGSQSSAGSAFTSKSATTKLVNEAEKENAIDGQATGLLTALFGALYTLAKEKINDSANVAMLAIWVDFLMIFTLILMPEYPWEVDSSLWIFKVFYYIQIHLPIANTGYEFYLVIFYILVAVLFVSVAICVWVGWCFMNDNFPFLWPIKVARVVVSLFVSMFYIASLNIFLMACACDKQADGHWKHLVFKLDCLSFPHLIHAIMSLTSGALFFAVAILLVLGDHELEPMSKSLLAGPHSMCELRSLLCKTVITIADILLKPLPRVQTVLYTMACGLIFYNHARMVPHYVPWINVLRGGLNAVLAWVSLVCCILTYTVHWEYDDKGHPHWDMHDYRHFMTTLMAVGVPVSFLAGAAICWGHLVYAWRAALKFRVLLEGIKPRNIHRFWSEFDVEVASRIGRVWDVEGVLDQTALEVAENVLKAGVIMKPNSVFMHIAYSNFLIDVRHNIQSGWNHLEQATKLGPNLSYQFSIFTRKQEHKQQSGGGGGGKGGAVDLVSYVEFQKTHKALMIYHKASLVATRDFWRLLTRDKVPLERLGHSFKRMDEMESKAEATYKMVLDRYPSNAKLLRSFGKFLESIKNDPWGAARYYAEAEKQEEPEESKAADIQTGNDTAVNDKSSGMISINASGIIQMANKVVTQMLGYKKGELNGKNVSCLMPAPFSTRHNSFLRNYINTGTAKILDTSREVVALHKERYVFPVSLKVTKISGSGVDATFMGVMKPATPDPTSIKAWLLPTGTTLCADLSFMDYAGWGPQELVGRAFSSLGTDGSELDDLIAQAASYTEEQLAAGALQLTTSIKHKYANDVPVHIKVELGGTDTQRILVMCMRRLADTPPMAAFDHKGHCIYANTPLASMLGYSLKALRSKDISHLLPQPFGVLHLKWQKDAESMQGRAAPNSCRNGMTSVMLTSNSTPVYVTPTIISHGPAAAGAASLAALTDHTASGSGSTFAIKAAGSSSRNQLASERRMCLGLSAAGSIVWAMDGTPEGLFGLAPGALLGQSITALVDIFADYASGRADADLAPPLAALINCVSAKPGTSWRVGVGCLTPEHQAKAQEAAAAAAATAAAEKRILLRQATTKTKAKAAVMTVMLPGDEALPEEAAASTEAALFVELWRSDMLFAVAEVVEGCSIVRAEPSMGLVFGSSHAKMLDSNLAQWVGLPPGTQLADLMGTKGHKKGGLKTSHMHKSGPCKQLSGLHADRRPLAVSLQACLKDGTQDSRLVLALKIQNPLAGAPGALAALVDAEEGSGQPAAEEAQHAVPGLALDKVLGDGTGDLPSPSRPTQRSNAPASNLVTARLIDVDLAEPDSRAGSKPGRAPAALAASPPGSVKGHSQHRHHAGEHVGFADGSPGGSAGGFQHGHEMDISSGSGSDAGHQAAGAAKAKKKHLTEEEMEAALAAKGASKAQEWLDSNFGGYKKVGGPALPGAVADADGPMQLVKGRPGAGSSSSSAGDDRAQQDAAEQLDQAAPKQKRAAARARRPPATAADGGLVSDYGRGKRLRKLVRLLSSKAALQTVMSFRFKVVILAAAIMLVHLGAFGAVLGFIGKQDAYMDEVSAAGEVLDVMHRMASLSLVLEAAERGYGFTAAATATYAAEMQVDYNRFDDLHQGLYLGFSGLRAIDTSALHDLWHNDGLNATMFLSATDPSQASMQRTSLFNLGAMYLAAAKEVQFAALHPTAIKEPGPLASNRNWLFLQANGPGALYEPYYESLNLMVARAESNIIMVQRMLLALLCIEGAAFMFVGVGVLIHLLASISVHRQALFSVFLAIPNSCLRTLASKSVSIGDDDADSEDEDDKIMQAAADARRKQQKRSEEADVQQEQDNDSMWGSMPGAVVKAAADNKKKLRKASFAALEEAPGDARVVVTARPGAGAAKGPSAGGLGASSFGGVSGPGAQHDRQRLFNGKELVASARSAYQLSWPIVLWAVLVLVLYGVSYNALSNTHDTMVSIKMTQKALVAASRVTYYSLRTSLEPDVAVRRTFQPVLASESEHLLWVYNAALYGLANTTASTTAQGDLDIGTGSLFASATHKRLLFDVQECIRYDPATCLDTSSPFWAITNNGVDGMVMRLAEESRLMSLFNASAIGPDSMGFQFVWQAAWFDLHDGMSQLVRQYVVETKELFSQQRALHIVLVVIMVLGGVAFLVMMLRPFLRHISKESRRCAELLVQLPPELDVEGMVAATWGVVKQERLMVERSGRTFIDNMGVKSLRAGLSMLSRSFLGSTQQQQQLAQGRGRLSALVDDDGGDHRLFTPRYAAQGPGARQPQPGSSRPAGHAREGFFEEVDGLEGGGGGSAFPGARASLDVPALRQRRQPGNPGATGPGIRGSPRAASRRVIVPVDDDVL